MATIMRIRQGIAVSVWDDRMIPLYKALGVIEVTRASEVEYDTTKCAWIATERTTGKIIACGPERNQVINDEVSYLERKL